MSNIIMYLYLGYILALAAIGAFAIILIASTKGVWAMIGTATVLLVLISIPPYLL